VDYQVSEDTVLLLWERYSGREMTSEEHSRARGHPLVAQLRSHPEAVLLRAACTAQRRGEDLHWRSWRDWTARHVRHRVRDEAKRTRQKAEVWKRAAGSESTDRLFNSNPRGPSRYTTDSGKASARAPGYSGGTLPHAKGRPSKHY
jgi:hypothetical protein